MRRPRAVNSALKVERGQVPIDIHAHYVPPQLIEAIAARGQDIGVRLARSGDAPPALHFDYGFKVRPFFARLVEPVAQRRIWLDEQGIDLQIVGIRVLSLALLQPEMYASTTPW